MSSESTPSVAQTDVVRDLDIVTPSVPEGTAPESDSKDSVVDDVHQVRPSCTDATSLNNHSNTRILLVSYSMTASPSTLMDQPRSHQSMHSV